MNAALAALALAATLLVSTPAGEEVPTTPEPKCSHPAYPAINAHHKAWVKRLYRQPYLPKSAKRKHWRLFECAPEAKQKRSMAKRWRIVKHPTRGVAVPNWQTWVNVGRCEQPGPGRWGVWWSHSGSTYSGGLGFYNASWSAFKLRGYPANAGQATWRQQMHTANNLWWSVGWGWGCSG